jgi:hypothetical protein
MYARYVAILQKKKHPKRVRYAALKERCSKKLINDSLSFNIVYAATYLIEHAVIIPVVDDLVATSCDLQVIRWLGYSGYQVTKAVIQENTGSRIKSGMTKSYIYDAM